MIEVNGRGHRPARIAEIIAGGLIWSHSETLESEFDLDFIELEGNWKDSAIFSFVISICTHRQLLSPAKPREEPSEREASSEEKSSRKRSARNSPTAHIHQTLVFIAPPFERRSCSVEPSA